jgi:hypothetical protein
LTARRELSAWIFAFAFDTSESRGAVGVVDAFKSHFRFAVNVRISDESRRTLADSHVVVSQTFRPRRAVVFVETWIDALFVDATLVGWAVIVAHTANNSADIAWVSTVATQASTLGLVVAHEALSVEAARVVDQAGVHAVLVDARLVWLTLRVASTANSATSNIGISFVAFLARADSAMALDCALGVGSAVTWISTLAVDAGLGVGAFAITETSGSWWWNDLSTFTAGIGNVKFWTGADHGANRKWVEDIAASWFGARRESRARIFACTVNAGEFRWAIAVDSALGLGISSWSLAEREWISLRQW